MNNSSLAWEKSTISPSSESLKHRTWLKCKDSTLERRDTFSVVSYNILADCHAQRDYGSSYDPRHLDADFRHAQILRELAYLDGDIVCLQEVSPDFYEGKLKDWYSSRGFHGYFIKRHNDYNDEGCATFYRHRKFSCKTVRLLDLSKVAEELFNSVQLNDDMRGTVKQRYAMHDVAIVTELSHTGTNQIVTVTNTHIDYGEFKKPDLQILQISCIKWILNEKFGGTPAILCGDFNLPPDSPQYTFATDGVLSDNQWEAIREQAQLPVYLINAVKKAVSKCQGESQFRSSYKYLKGEEPGVTCVNNEYRDCLDYVMYRDPLIPSNEDSKSSQTQAENKTNRSKILPFESLDMPPLEHILTAVPPSGIYPSDHLPLFVEFALES